MKLEALFTQKTKEAMLKSLENYKKGKDSSKEFYPCTKLLSEWLEQKEK